MQLRTTFEHPLGEVAALAAFVTPRGLTDYELWRLVCSGQYLTGAERAGDVTVALADSRKLPQVEWRVTPAASAKEAQA